MNTTSPAVAMLVGTLVLAAIGGGGKHSATATAAPAAAAVATQVASADTSELADTVAGFINQLRGEASGATADFVRSMRGEGGEKTVERRVPISAAQAKAAAALPDPRPLVQHVHLKRPPPAPPKTQAELAEVMAQRAMYECIKSLHEQEDQAVAAQ